MIAPKATIRKSRVRKSGPTAASKISAAELLREIPGAKVVAFRPGEVIFREGTKTGSCYLVTDGKVRILKKSSGGGEIPLTLVKPGEFLGEMAMLSGEKRSASAVAVTKASAIVITHAEFVKLLKSQNLFAIRLSLQLSTLLATRCHYLLRLIARQPHGVPTGARNTPHVDVRAVLSRVYTLWAV